MPIKTAIWRVGAQPEPLIESSLSKEQLLESMIVAAPSMLSDEWMLIGRQEDTGYGGRIDLLAIAPDGSLILIELKRDRTPREVVAQALDYAAWVEKLRGDEIAAIYGRFASGRNLASDFFSRFGQKLNEDSLNTSHQIVIVASSLDGSTERIVSYLSDHEVPINVLFFQVFAHGDQQLLSRSWLLNPLRTQVIAATTPTEPSEPWNGEFYCSFGEGEARSWTEAVRYGFVCGGGGPWYSRTLKLLAPGDRVWVKIPDVGFVGVGRVTGRSQPASEFVVPTPDGQRPALRVLSGATYHREFADDPDHCEYFVPVRWAQTREKAQAFYDTGLFGNQNTVCKPTTPKWRATVERLKEEFLDYNK